MRRTPRQIPWAIDTRTGDWLRADRAEHHAERGRYRCTDIHCERDLTVARSKRGRQHFKHFRDGHAEGCTFRDTTHGPHQTAIRVLLARFSNSLAQRTPMPLLSFSTPSGIRVVLPFIQASDVALEWVCPASGRRVDLALLDSNSSPILLVEVLHTNEVDEAKRRDLGGNWWIEVKASQVLNDPDTLLVQNHGNLPRSLASVWEQNALFEA